MQAVQLPVALFVLLAWSVMGAGRAPSLNITLLMQGNPGSYASHIGKHSVRNKEEYVRKHGYQLVKWVGAGTLWAAHTCFCVARSFV